MLRRIRVSCLETVKGFSHTTCEELDNDLDILFESDRIGPIRYGHLWDDRPGAENFCCRNSFAGSDDNCRYVGIRDFCFAAGCPESCDQGSGISASAVLTVAAGYFGTACPLFMGCAVVG